MSDILYLLKKIRYDAIIDIGDNMEIIIKKATINELKILQELWNELFTAQYEYDKDLKVDWPLTVDGENYLRKMVENEIVYLAYFFDKPVGYIDGSYSKDFPFLNKKVAEINFMYVREEYRGNNIGSLLINEFKKECNIKGIYSYDVSVYCKNIKGIKFYEKNGFDKELDITLSCDN